MAGCIAPLQLASLFCWEPGRLLFLLRDGCVVSRVRCGICRGGYVVGALNNGASMQLSVGHVLLHDMFFDDESAEVVISTLRLGEEQDRC
jgi:hypothetical protein